MPFYCDKCQKSVRINHNTCIIEGNEYWFLCGCNNIITLNRIPNTNDVSHITIRRKIHKTKLELNGTLYNFNEQCKFDTTQPIEVFNELINCWDTYIISETFSEYNKLFNDENFEWNKIKYFFIIKKCDINVRIYPEFEFVRQIL